MKWIYLDEQRQQVESTEDGLRKLSAAGVLKPDTLVWNESLPDWQPLGQAIPGIAMPTPGATPMSAVPRSGIPSGAQTVPLTTTPMQSPAQPARRLPQANPIAAATNPPPVGNQLAPTGDAKNLVPHLAGILSAHSGWIKFFAILMIISGAMQCLTIVYAIIGWFPIWMGVLLMGATQRLEQANLGNQQALEEAMEKIGRFFKISGIFAIASFALVVLIFVVMMLLGGIGALMESGAFPVPAQ